MRLKWLIVAVAVVAAVTLAYYRLRPRGESELGNSISTSTPVTDGSSVDVMETVGDQHPLDPLLEKARGFMVRFESDVQDYTARIVKRERINGQLGEEATMEAKIRPASKDQGIACYLKFVAPASSKGREVIWIDGENEGRLACHEGGIKNWKRFDLQPNGMLAMLGNKYPISQIGLKRLIEQLIEKGEHNRSIGSCKVQAIPDQRVGDRKCTLYQIVHREKDLGYSFHIAQIFIDDELQIPLRYAAFMWPEKPGGDPILDEEYTYLDVKLNVGLTDIDFDPDNPDYEFP